MKDCATRMPSSAFIKKIPPQKRSKKNDPRITYPTVNRTRAKKSDTSLERLDRLHRQLHMLPCHMRPFLEPSGSCVGFSPANKARADQFLNDMICLLDGPEQRDVPDKARAFLKSSLTDMTAQKDELPPCPFCGNEPVLLNATEWDGFER